ncbi:uncharacterized protein LOC109703839 [Ananas comosus]|uniref:Uncharacterized protein LOC109703839 n=1 Tax=Ananas comosus TaxID=4615 RepID=A0A6P5EAD7_ANACO|nr:uncharacterized protein LOC109703839 [Ananas comosus]
MGNDSSVDVLGVGTYKLIMQVSSTPYELWTCRKPNLEHLRPWGSAAYVQNTSHKYGKLGPRGRKCIFIRYPDHSKGYVFIGKQPDGSLTEIESRNVEFFEENFPYRSEVRNEIEFHEMDDSDIGASIRSVEGEEATPIPPGDSGSDLPLDKEPQIRRSARTDLRLIGYSDADWAGDLDERKSTSGYAFLLGNGAITWSSKKQTCIALSTMEAEFVACSAAAQEAIWMRRFLRDIGIVACTSVPVTIYCDSMAAIAYAKDPKYHGKTKHIDLKYHFVREAVAQKEIILEHISTSCMVADPPTKPIVRESFLAHVKALGLRRI